ncbi:MAG: hypothetical protein H7145_03410 [Akkermansiaceae bacterium]|nr:hypothetical protein [Armatimonadota bacterium]
MQASPHDLTFHPDPPITRSERVTDYLDHLSGPLLSHLPLRERHVFRAEAEDHLYALIAEHEASGLLTAEEATTTALREYGEPWKVGTAFLEAWQARGGEGESGVRRGSRPYAAALTAFAFFGLGSVVTIGILQASRVLLKPNPILWTVLMVLVFVSPILAGCAVAYRAYTKPARAVCVGMLPVLCHSLLTAWMMLPFDEFLTLAAVQGGYWLPVGAGCASLVFNLRQHRRRQTYLRRVLS